MHTHVFDYHRPRAASTRINVRVPRPSLRALRAWLNEPPRHEPVPIVGAMYGLWLRPADRSDIHRRVRR